MSVSISKETQAVAAAHGALERLLAACDEHLESLQPICGADLRAAMREAERVARAVAPHAVESRDTMPSTRPGIRTSAGRPQRIKTHVGTPDWESDPR